MNGYHSNHDTIKRTLLEKHTGSQIFFVLLVKPSRDLTAMANKSADLSVKVNMSLTFKSLINKKTVSYKINFGSGVLSFWTDSPRGRRPDPERLSLSAGWKSLFRPLALKPRLG